MGVSVEAKHRASDAKAALRRIEGAVAQVIQGKPEAIRLAVTTFAAGGHLLIEDVPGVGKTTLARALAKAVGGSFRRIQFTSDLLPSDILGSNVFNQRTGAFEFRPGPIFANLVLADEINRTTPRTQSALLEAMSERKISIDGESHELGSPFMVIATQNPIEHFGTYPLPESQMDRFLLRIRLGYPAPQDERRVVLADPFEDVADEIEPVLDAVDLKAILLAVKRVRVEESLFGYAEQVVGETRQSNLLQLGVSPRGFQAWLRAAKAYAQVSGRDFLVPDDLKETALSALSHRVVPTGGGDFDGHTQRESERVIAYLLERVPVPM